MTFLFGRIGLREGPITAETLLLNDPKRKVPRLGLLQLPVIGCEVGALGATLQEKNQLPVRHVDHLTVARHVLYLVQSVDSILSLALHRIWAQLRIGLL